MQLHVRLASGGDSSAAGAGSQDAASGLQKWALIELQGTIAALGGELAGVDLGGLNVLPDGKVELMVGSHRAVGKVQKLKKPLAIMRRSSEPAPAPDVDLTARGRVKRALRMKPATANAAPAGGGGAEGAGGGDTEAETRLAEGAGRASVDGEFLVHGVITHKYLFTSRPQPIIRRATKRKRG